jgi:glycosyltransferase involved in cell wall biosynthesis
VAGSGEREPNADARIDLLLWSAPSPEWPLGDVVVLPGGVGAAASVVDEHAASTAADLVLFWDPRRGAPDPATIAGLARTRADAWHAGLSSGLGGLPEEHDYIHPTWPLALDGPADRVGVSWRLGLDALLVRTEVLRTLGSLDPACRERAGAGLELGRRLIDRGAVVVHTPALAPSGSAGVQTLDEHDRFVFLRRVFTPKWVRYAAVRRALAGHDPWAIARAYRSSGAACASHPRPGGPDRVVTRPPVDLPADPSVTVVLPTLGRYELLRPVLEQLRHQTVAPLEVIVVDQNDPDRRDHALYAEFADIGLRVIFQEERGQWVSRNAAVAASRGEWIAFIDDDSEIGPDFIEHHLEGLARYRADLSTGASLAVVGAPVPENYAFFRVADQWDSGNGMCHRKLFEEFGLFDQQFDRQRRGDAEFGLRVQVGGGLVIHNPHAVRVHLKAAEGGLRTFGSWDGFRHRDRTSPLPLPSVVYYARRYHTRRQLREDLLIGLTQAIVPYELKRRASPRQWAKFVLGELVHVPSSVRRIRRSLAIADEMVAAGPKIPRLHHDEHPGGA